MSQLNTVFYLDESIISLVSQFYLNESIISLVSQFYLYECQYSRVQNNSKFARLIQVLKVWLLGNHVHLILTLRSVGEALGFPRNFQVHHELMKL